MTIHADSHTCELRHPSDSRSIPGRSNKEAGSFPSSLLSFGWPNITCPSALQKSPKLIKSHCVTCSATSSLLTGTAPGAAKQKPIGFLIRGFRHHSIAWPGEEGLDINTASSQIPKANSSRCFGCDIIQKRGLSCIYCYRT